MWRSRSAMLVCIALNCACELAELVTRVGNDAAAGCSRRSSMRRAASASADRAGVTRRDKQRRADERAPRSAMPPIATIAKRSVRYGRHRLLQ